VDQAREAEVARIRRIKVPPLRMVRHILGKRIRVHTWCFRIGVWALPKNIPICGVLYQTLSLARSLCGILKPATAKSFKAHR